VNKVVSYTLVFIVTANIDVMVAEGTGLAQVEDPVASIHAEDSAVQTLAGEPSAVEFVAAPVAMEATTITVLEVSATTSVSKEPVVGLIPAQIKLAPISVTLPAPSWKGDPGVHQQGYLQPWTS